MRDDDDLGERPVEDPLVLQVARSRIANALFETDERIRIGRYQLLQRAGAGGMGAVWSAWDPELERRVAIKLMHVKSEAARESMLREGQALAKLSHPNIVPIYDVGTVDDQVYLVMEWIAGVTLRAYVAERRSVRDLVAIYLAAGAGVAAAHDAGIVQRDFKPDNVMIGDDRRVRVLDFGLASGSDAGGQVSISGTPRYMAPEQAKGEAATPAADQFSFGVSLKESLSASGDVPAWIAAVIARATQPAPAARFPDMAELLAALARDPARVWRRRALVAAAALVALAAFAIGTYRGGDEPEVCGGTGDLAEAWNPASSSALVARLQELGPYGAAQAPVLAELLSAYNTRWAVARRDACFAHHRNDVTPALYERGLACLERARGAFDAVATTLSRTPADRLPSAVLAARNLPVPDRCLRDATTDPIAPPAPELAARVSAIDTAATRAFYLALALDPAALELARTAARDAELVGYAPLVARTQTALGVAFDRSAEAIRAFGTATTAALEGGDDLAFVEAFARRLYAVARHGDRAVATELVAALPYVQTIGKRTGDAGRFARALLYNNAGTERLAAGDRKGAIAWFRKALDEPAPSQPAAELLAILGNLAINVPDRTERETLFAAERVQLERILGADHVRVLAARLRAALFVEDPRRAITLLGELCEPYGRLHPQERGDSERCHYELAWMSNERGDRATARRSYQAVVATGRPTESNKIAQAEVARLSGDGAAALALVEPLARQLDRSPNWWDRLLAVDAWLVVAAVRDARGDRAGALAARRAAHTAAGVVVKSSSATAALRRVARANAELALASGDRTLAADALAWYRSAGGYDAAIEQLSR